MTTPTSISARPMSDDLTGKVFGRYTVVGLVPPDGRGPKWSCSCDCGKQRDVRAHALQSGRSQSCGCLSRNPTNEAILARFLKFVKISESGCWEWTGNLDICGYGKFYFKKRGNYSAHRASYEMHVGAIPEGFQLDHLCRNVKCVNPAHLEAVTPRENTLRSTNAVAIYAQRDRCLRGHEFSFDVRVGKRVCRECPKIRYQEREQRKKQASA